MKSLSILGLILILAQAVSAQISTSKIKDFEFLIGSFEVHVNLPDGKGGWQQGGKGTAEFYPILDNTFIREEIATTMGNTTFTMSNTFGIDGRSGQTRLFALDREYSTMDIYYGKIEEDKLIYDNLKSDIPAKTRDGQDISFRLTYSKVNENENEILAEITLDKGKTWRPYAKNKFIRVKAETN